MPRGRCLLLGVVYDFVSTAATAVIICGIGSYVFTFLGFIEYMKERLIDIVIEDNYLKKLGPEKVKLLMEKLEQIIYKNADLSDDGLLKFVQKEVHPFITEHYYEEYITHVNCKLIDGNKVEKETNRRVVIAKKGYGASEIDVSQLFRTSLKGTKEESENNISLLFMSINGEETDEYELKHENIEKDKDYCNSFRLFGDKILIENGRIIIVIKTKTIVDIDDYSYTQRVKVPCRNFTLHFHFEGDDMTVGYDQFGFMSRYQPDRVITENMKNCVVVRFTNWMLPGDGVVFTLLRKDCFSN